MKTKLTIRSEELHIHPDDFAEARRRYPNARLVVNRNNRLAPE